MSIKSKQLHLNRKFDQIRQMEESGELKNKKSGNRALRKLLNNRLAIVGGVIFLIILLACIFAEGRGYEIYSEAAVRRALVWDG